MYWLIKAWSHGRIATSIFSHDLEICRNCGNEVEELDEYTGFCYNCSPKRCERCNKRSVPKGKHFCNSCTRIIWLETHADEIEELQSGGLSLTAARQAIYANNRPVCLVCHQPMNHANVSASFCQRTKDCRSARRRYRTLRVGAQKLSPEIAREQVLRELGLLWWM